MNNETIKRSEAIESIKALHNILGDAGTKAAVMALDGVPAAGEWISVKDRLPELPYDRWCSVMVNTYRKVEKRVHAMIYERAVVRGKTVERWKYCWGRIADIEPDYWMPLPDAPKEDIQ